MTEGYRWASRACLCDDDVNGRECYCYEAPRCTCDQCQSAADAGRAERMADTGYSDAQETGWPL